jgi:hypothetical protein
MTLARSKAMILSLDADIITEWVKLQDLKTSTGLWKILEAVEDKLRVKAIISLDADNVSQDVEQDLKDLGETVDEDLLDQCAMEVITELSHGDWSWNRESIDRDAYDETLKLYRERSALTEAGNKEP